MNDPVFFFEEPARWRQYMEELGIQRAIDYLNDKGLPATWPEMVVDKEAFGAVFENEGKPHYRSQCPHYEGYWLLGGIGSVQCKAEGELIPGLAWYAVCSKGYEQCPFYKKEK